MTVPKSITVGGRRVTIRFRKYDFDDYGEYDYEGYEIRLNRRVIPDAKTLRETLRHELLHAALHVCHLTYADRFEEESVVRCIDETFFPAWERLQSRLP